jgi:hypothetical protein
VDSALEPLIRRVRSEYCEMPGLQLTPRQFGRLFRLSPAECDGVIAVLVSDRFLYRTTRGVYGRVESWRVP